MDVLWRTEIQFPFKIDNSDYLRNFVCLFVSRCFKWMIGSLPKVRANTKCVPSSRVGNLKCHHWEIRAHSPFLPFLSSFLKSQAYPSSRESLNAPSDHRLLPQRWYFSAVFTRQLTKPTSVAGTQDMSLSGKNAQAALPAVPHICSRASDDPQESGPVPWGICWRAQQHLGMQCHHTCRCV